MTYTSKNKYHLIEINDIKERKKEKEKKCNFHRKNFFILGTGTA